MVKRDYYANRAAQAIGMAEAAKDGYVANIHFELAANYIKLAKLAEDASPPVRPPLHLVLSDRGRNEAR